MSSANLPDRWLGDRRFRRENLPDAAYRAYINALMYAVNNRTDGVIGPADLKYIPDFDRAAIKPLIEGGLWSALSKGLGWFIVDYPTTQSSKNLLESYDKRKAYDRDRKAKQAADKRAAQSNSGGNSGGSFPVESLQSNAKQSKAARTGEVSTRRDGEVIALGNRRDDEDVCARCDGWIAAGDAAGPGDNPAWCRDCNDDARTDMADQP